MDLHSSPVGGIAARLLKKTRDNDPKILIESSNRASVQRSAKDMIQFLQGKQGKKVTSSELEDYLGKAGGHSMGAFDPAIELLVKKKFLKVLASRPGGDSTYKVLQRQGSESGPQEAGDLAGKSIAWDLLPFLKKNKGKKITNHQIDDFLKKSVSRHVGSDDFTMALYVLQDKKAIKKIKRVPGKPGELPTTTYKVLRVPTSDELYKEGESGIDQKAVMKAAIDAAKDIHGEPDMKIIKSMVQNALKKGAKDTEDAIQIVISMMRSEATEMAGMGGDTRQGAPEPSPMDHESAGGAAQSGVGDTRGYTRAKKWKEQYGGASLSQSPIAKTMREFMDKQDKAVEDGKKKLRKPKKSGGGHT